MLESQNWSQKAAIQTEKGYWLMKSDADSYSIEDFEKEKRTLWDGVRNYQARNFMMRDMKVGDEVLFYHSRLKEPGVVGKARIIQEAVPDPTALDAKSQYYDPRASKEKPIWHCVRVEHTKTFKRKISLGEIRKEKILKNMLLLKRGQRLSIQPLTQKEFEWICFMEKER